MPVDHAMTHIDTFESSAALTSAPLVNPMLRGPILVALRGRTSAPAAISAARLLASRLGLGVEVVTVTPAEPGYPEPMDIMPDHRTPSRVADAEHEREVRDAVRQALGSERSWPVTLRHGRPAMEIVRVAEAINATLIILNAMPGGTRRTVAGALATDVARRSVCPVLSVNAPLTTLPKSIVAAVDFSPASIRAAQAAVLIADEHATLTLLHLPMPLRFAHPRVDRSGAPIGADVGRLFDRLEAELLRYAPGTLKMQRVVVDGSAVSTILEQAGMRSADLIVAGTHGPNRFERFIVGSTAVSLLHLALSPVLIAPAPPPAERVRLELGMTDTTVLEDSKEWAEVLASVAARNRGRIATLDVAGPPAVHASELMLRELAYDAVDRCVEVRLTDSPDGRCGLTRTIGHPSSIVISRTPDGRERALEIVQGRGHTLLLFEEAD
jgi:nucleotide-binding universal stress UspA family protein